MFVLKPDTYRTPSYRIGPFQTSDIAFNCNLPDDYRSLDYFSERFRDRKTILTINGRAGINLALSSYNLGKKDIVTILTTSQNFYISSCVTNEIEKFCRWNREITSETKVILVNHEFGYPYQNMDQLMKLGIPVIEDCCTTFFSQDCNHQIGSYGDFAVYSFPKFFPLQIGGLLICNSSNKIRHKNRISQEEYNYILKVVSYYMANLEQLLTKREIVYSNAVHLAEKQGFSERFEQKENIVPSVLLLRNHGIVKDLPALKTYLWEHGIHSSIFYGEDGFFIPCHQRLSMEDLNYFFTVIKSFIEKESHDNR